VAFDVTDTWEPSWYAGILPTSSEEEKAWSLKVEALTAIHSSEVLASDEKLHTMTQHA
jgi:hypothetical protein